MNTKTLILLLTFFFILTIVFSLFKKTTKGIHNPYLNLFKPLIPSWKFYDDYEETMMLFYRVHAGEWTQLYRLGQSRVSSLFINPEGNLTLAAHSHIEQLLHDIENYHEEIPFEQTLTYKITKNFITYALHKKYKNITSFQFKLASVNIQGEPKEDILISPVYSGADI